MTTTTNDALASLGCPSKHPIDMRLLTAENRRPLTQKGRDAGILNAWEIGTTYDHLGGWMTTTTVVEMVDGTIRAFVRTRENPNYGILP